jgi:hypothetical protein
MCVFIGVGALLTVPIWSTAIGDHNVIRQTRAPAVHYTGELLNKTNLALQYAMPGEVVQVQPHAEDQGCNRGTYLLDPGQWQNEERICNVFGTVSYVVPHGAPGSRDQQREATSAATVKVDAALEQAGLETDRIGIYDGLRYVPQDALRVGDHSIPVVVHMQIESGEEYNTRNSGLLNSGRRVAPDALLISETIDVTYFDHGGGTIAPRQAGDN